jgi:hypothetical protein
LQTKAIAQVRVSAADVKDWFHSFRIWCGIKAGDVLNFDEAGFRVGVAYVKEVSILF